MPRLEIVLRDLSILSDEALEDPLRPFGWFFLEALFMPSDVFDLIVIWIFEDGSQDGRRGCRKERTGILQDQHCIFKLQRKEESGRRLLTDRCPVDGIGDRGIEIDTDILLGEALYVDGTALCLYPDEIGDRDLVKERCGGSAGFKYSRVAAAAAVHVEVDVAGGLVGVGVGVRDRHPAVVDLEAEGILIAVVLLQIRGAVGLGHDDLHESVGGVIHAGFQSRVLGDGLGRRQVRCGGRIPVGLEDLAHDDVTLAADDTEVVDLEAGVAVKVRIGSAGSHAYGSEDGEAGHELHAAGAALSGCGIAMAVRTGEKAVEKRKVHTKSPFGWSGYGFTRCKESVKGCRKRAGFKKELRVQKHKLRA